MYYRQHHTAKNEWKPYSLTYVDHHWGVKAREFHVFRAENSDQERIPTDGWTKGNKRFPFPELSVELGEPSFCHCLDILAKDVSGREMQFHGRYNAIYEFRCGRQTFKHENGEYTLYVDNRYGWVILNKSNRVLPSFKGQTQPALTLCPADQRYESKNIFSKISCLFRAFPMEKMWKHITRNGNEQKFKIQVFCSKHKTNRR